MAETQVRESEESNGSYGAGLPPGGRCLAPYAASRIPSRGRLHPEPECPTRSPHQRDRDRIIHSTAFRRLTYKTQVFVFHEGDHYRNRLTHTIEVAQIARTIARQLRLDEDLAETLALAHDLGHPPFGHSGERALDRVLAAHGGFDHNVQSFRLVTSLERKYLDFNGLNLTWETLEGLVKHSGPPAALSGPPHARICHALRRFDAAWSLELDRWPSAEAQVAMLADDIAWMTHDTDDGLRAGLITVSDLCGMPLLSELVAAAERAPALDSSRRIYGITRQLITRLIADAVAASRERLGVLAPRDASAIRGAGEAVVSFSASLAADVDKLKAFLFERLYRHPHVVGVMGKAETIVEELFERYFEDPAALPEAWRAGLSGQPERRRARLVADFIAGMTDRFAVAEHRRLFDATPELR